MERSSMHGESQQQTIDQIEPPIVGNADAPLGENEAAQTARQRASPAYAGSWCPTEA